MHSIRHTIGLLLLTLLISVDAHAQVGRDSKLWSWTTGSSHHNAIAQVALDDGLATGVIIGVNREKPISDGYEGYCLTAYHVVESDKGRRAIKVRYSNGRSSSNCKVLQSDPELDIAILWVWVPAQITPAIIASEPARHGDHLELAGLGGATDRDCCLRSFSARASAPTDEDTIYADVTLLPGDSGGPVFNDRQEVVGVISGGWFWWDGGIVTDDGSPIIATWPARAANRQVIQKLLDRI